MRLRVLGLRASAKIRNVAKTLTAASTVMVSLWGCASGSLDVSKLHQGDSCQTPSLVCDCQATPACASSGIGPAAGGPGPDAEPQGFPVTVGSGPLELTPEGYLKLKTTPIEDHFIWINSTGTGQVTKVSTRATNADGTFKPLARYWTGPRTGAPVGGDKAAGGDGGAVLGNDPSRTAVNSSGDVFIANRKLHSVSSIRAVGCRGTNTSQGIHDIKPWGQDDCVQWYTNLEGKGVFPNERLRAIVAQDLFGSDGAVSTYVWVGDFNRNLWKLNGRTGEILLATTSPTQCYGFALDRFGQLWISGRRGHEHYTDGYLGRVNTQISENDARWNSPVCYGEGGDADDPDKCVKQAIPIPAGAGGYRNPYGMTVDREQNVWLADQEEPGVKRGGLYRYNRALDPGLATNAPNGRWSYAPLGHHVYGVAADRLGFVYAGGLDWGVHIFSRAAFPSKDAKDYLLMPNSGLGWPFGMAVDYDDKVWAIGRGPLPDPASNPNHPVYHSTDDFATVIKKTEGAEGSARTLRGPDEKWYTFSLHNDSPYGTQAIFTFPYTYSDMTGMQTRYATTQLGRFVQVLEGCTPAGGVTHWKSFAWAGSTPPGTYLTWYARTADSLDALKNEKLVLIAQTPSGHGGDEHRFDLPTLLGGKSIARYLEIQVDLSADLATQASPVLSGFEASRECVLIAF